MYNFDTLKLRYFRLLFSLLMEATKPASHPVLYKHTSTYIMHIHIYIMFVCSS